MSARFAACLFAISFAGAVAAQEATPDTWMHTAASKSRDEVKAELAQARRDGGMRAFALNYDFAGKVASVKSRDDVRSELAQARKDGGMRVFALNYDFAGKTASTKSREQVRAELIAARHGGEY